MIKVEILGSRSGFFENSVKSAAKFYHQDTKPSGMFAMDVALTTVEQNLKRDITAIPRVNGGLAEFSYKVVKSIDATGQYLAIEHRTLDGDLDRTIAIIRDNEKPLNNW